MIVVFICFLFTLLVRKALFDSSPHEPRLYDARTKNILLSVSDIENLYTLTFELSVATACPAVIDETTTHSEVEQNAKHAYDVPEIPLSDLCFESEPTSDRHVPAMDSAAY
jgi:hypothetical protein